MESSTAGVVEMNIGENQYSQFVRRRIKISLLLLVGASLILVLIGYKPEAKGLALGGLFSILNFLLLSKAVPNAVGRSRRSGTTLSALWMFGRMALMAIPLAAALKISIFNFPATVIGLFIVQFTIILEPVIKKLVRR